MGVNIIVSVTRVGTFDQYVAGVTEKAKKALAVIGQQVRSQAIQNMKGSLQRYGNSITVRGPTESAEGLSVEVGSFSGGKETAMLAAHELGSGTHRTVGEAGTYPIRPVNAPQLVFLWPNPPWGYVHPKIKQIQMPGGPLVFLGHVNHPGVRPQFFLTRAVRDNTEQFKAMFIEAIKP